jgi:hypothetical protein
MCFQLRANHEGNTLTLQEFGVVLERMQDEGLIKPGPNGETWCMSRVLIAGFHFYESCCNWLHNCSNITS